MERKLLLLLFIIRECFWTIEMNVALYTEKTLADKKQVQNRALRIHWKK
jgi:hypothetical protein